MSLFPSWSTTTKPHGLPCRLYSMLTYGLSGTSIEIWYNVSGCIEWLLSLSITCRAIHGSCVSASSFHMLVMSFQNLYIPSILLLLFPKKTPEIELTLIIPWSSDIKSYPNTITATVKLLLYLLCQTYIIHLSLFLQMSDVENIQCSIVSNFYVLQFN